MIGLFEIECRQDTLSGSHTHDKTPKRILILLS